MNFEQDCGVAEAAEPRDAVPLRLRLDIGYDGTAFHGWAKQPGLRTVQHTLEEAISRIFGPYAESSEEYPRLTVAGRTDAGVHARGQVAHLDVSPELASRVTARRVNSILNQSYRNSQADGELTAPGSDVSVHAIHEVPSGFDARFSALSRRYEYRVRPLGVASDPLSTRFTVDIGRELELSRIQQASDELVGLHDFAAFCKAREGATSVRDLHRFEWRQDDRGVFVATIEADAFCHSMVRALVGAVVAAGSGRLTMSELVSLRDARKRTSQFTVMPAHGLSLEEITYPADGDLALRAEQTRARRDPLA